MSKDNMKVISSEDSLCSGCGLCRNLCAKSAISMSIAANGFFYPIIDSEKCVKCGLCHSMCPALLPPLSDSEAKTPDMFALKCKDSTVHEAASSGGAFLMLSDLILQEGGIIYGCSFDEEWVAMHQRAESYDERDRMCGSKYVQSDIGETYTLCGQDLKKGKTVMFTGTPCQIDALHKYLAFKKINEENLITIDLICHGVPSPKTWQEHLNKIKDKYKAKPKKVSFRKKDKQGNAQALYIGFDNGKEYFSRSGHDLYYKCFLKNYHLRPSCYNCRYTSLNRVSDITLGDFGGVSKVNPEFNADHMGVSQVHINTEKGSCYFERIKERAEYFGITVEQAMQPNLWHPTLEPEDNDLYEKTLKSRGLEAAAWSVSNSKEKAQMILNKFNISEIIYKTKHGGATMIKDILKKLNGGG